MRRALRVLAVTGVWVAATFVAPGAGADHTISFTACEPPPSPTPTSSPGASPTASPTPTPASSPDGTGSPQPTETSTPQNCVPAPGAVIQGTHTLRFEVNAPTRRIHTVELYILADEEGIPPANNGDPVRVWTHGNRSQAPEHQAYAYPWDSIQLTPHNGRYWVLVTAYTHELPPNSGRSSHVAVEDRRDLRVDNAPGTPAAPRIVAKTDAQITVEWDEAPEPDVLSYTLYRAASNNPEKAPPIREFKAVETTSSTTFRDKVSEGIYWYSLQVTRRSVVTPDTGISSPLSPVSKATKVEASQEVAAAPDGAPAAPPQPRVFSRLPRVTVSAAGRPAPAPVPDAPFSAFLPYDLSESDLYELGDQPEPGGDPRGPVLPVAVGAFLVSSSLALGRMPY